MQGSRSPVPYLLLAWLAGAWIAGIAASATFGEAAWPLAAAIAASALTFALARRNRLAAVYSVALPAIFLLAVASERAASSQPLADDDVAHFNDGVAMRIRGVVRDDPEIGDTTQRFTVDAREVQRGGAWVEASGGVQVVTAILPRYQAGDVLEFEGKLQSPPQLDDFDYAAYLAQRGIHSTMGFPEAHVIGHDDPRLIRRILLETRRELSRGIGLALPEPQAALALGVLLGQRSALDADTLDDLNTTNTSHLVVVSGGNVVLVASFFTIVFAWFVRRRQAQALAIVAVIAYGALVGFSPPVLRATIMGIVLIAAGMSGRRTNGLTSILLAAAVMTALDPRIIRDVSFQLSFAATAGIIWLASPLRRSIIGATAWALRRDDIPRWTATYVAEPAAVTLAAVIATTPLLALNFERVSLVAIPANLFVVPAFPLILLSSLVAAVGGLMPFGHVAFGAPAYALLSYWLTVASWLASLPAAAATTGAYSTPWAIATYAALLALAPLAARVLRRVDGAQVAASHRFRWRSAARRMLYVAPAVALVVGIGWIAGGSSPARLEVTVLDVGQGDAILIETPSGSDVLVDGGPGPVVLRGLADELAWDDRSLDLVVLTHPQIDHGTGLIDVFDRYEVERALITSAGSESLLARTLAEAASAEGAAVTVAHAGQSFDLGDGVMLEVLWPPAVTEDTNVNNAGIVLRLSFGGVSFLLAADIEADAEVTLVESGVDLRANVLKVAHQGSKTSSTRGFLDAVQPNIAVISSGAGNRFGHPAPEVIERLDDYAAIYNTATDGDVRLETDGTRLWIDTDR